MDGEITPELLNIYANAEKEGIWLREWAVSNLNGKHKWMAGAGSVEKLQTLEEKTGEEIDVYSLPLQAIMHISSPGTGNTREEACQNAVDAFKEYLKKSG